MNDLTIVNDEGDLFYYKKGTEILHREGAPAAEFLNGTKLWYENGLQHRIGGPAIEYYFGDRLWFENGKLHREDGPAIEHFSNDTILYYIRGKQYSKEEFMEITGL